MTAAPDVAGGATLRHMLRHFAAWLDDADVTEIVVNRPGEVAVERRGAWTWYDVPALTFDALLAIATLAASTTGQHVGEDRPLLSTTLPGGQRLQANLPPVAPEGTVLLTIRNPPRDEPTMDWLDERGFFDDAVPCHLIAAVPEGVREPERTLLRLYAEGRWKAFLELAPACDLTCVPIGSTGSGKTTLSRAMARHLPETDRVVLIEDAREMARLRQRNAASMVYSRGGQGVAEVKSEDLMRAALRMRPDKILVGELRGPEAFVWLRGIATGHPGGGTTIHGGSVAGGFDALAIMVREHESGRAIPDADLKRMLRDAVDVAVHCAKRAGRYRITQVYYKAAADLAGAAP